MKARLCATRLTDKEEVKQASLDTIGVTGTPTMLLVDAKGTVSKVWEGKVQPHQQAGVLAALK